ncbi:MAG: conserved membrane protein of unknown function [Promethearchaeota archaeon]|nr:MAG: conserved membrane protein of unknown function [Candidatus Lokiarchaeota archaeon]
MALDPIIVVNGVSSLIFVIISILVGIFIMANYSQHKNVNLIYVGLAWIGLSEPWWPSSISFLVSLSNVDGLDKVTYFFIGNVFIPIFVLLWLLAMANLLDWKLKKQMSILYIIGSVIYEIVFIYYLFTSPDFIGTKNGPVDVDYELFTILFQFINLVIVVGTGLWFAINSLKSDQKRVKLKGEFLLIAFISFVVGTAWDIVATHPLSRLILVISAIIFYIGYVLPPSIEKILIEQ